jgi:trehalose synthase
MLKKVSFKSIVQAEDFLEYLDKEHRDEIEVLAVQLKGKKIVHISSTANGGGVAELLKSTVPYLAALGVDASWYVIDPVIAGRYFFDFTNRLHNALQGSSSILTEDQWKVYEDVSKKIADDLSNIQYDALIVHDPQPLGAVLFVKNPKPKIAQIHIDTSSAEEHMWAKILPALFAYERILFSNESFAHRDLAKEKIRVFPPAIDPLASKQISVSRQQARSCLADFGIDQEGILTLQVSRFDVWKNPYGVIEAFWLVEKEFPGAKLALVGFQEARDNPHAEKVYNDIKGMVGSARNIFLFFDPGEIGGSDYIQEFTAMAQSAADVVVQNSTKEGFGLTVTEAMWKGKPVIGGPASGIRRQIQDGENGYIATNTHELADRLRYLFENSEEGRRIGEAGKESVLQNFLMPRFVLDHMRVYKELL